MKKIALLFLATAALVACANDGSNGRTAGTGGVGAAQTGGVGSLGSGGISSTGAGGVAGGSNGGAGNGGTAGGTGGAGGPGAAGNSGGAGTMGGAGTTGGANTTGSAGTTGTAGTTGSAGTAATGSAGTGARGGTTGGGGAAGTGGSGGGAGNTGGGVGTKVSVDASGKYTVTFAQPPWAFGGDLGAAASGVATTAGSDAVGPYHETTFSYARSGTRSGRIRAYDQLPVVVFGETNAAAASNIRNFPRFTTVPSTPYHLAYQDTVFALYSLSSLAGDSPWVFFDGNANTFILSAASHFMNAEARQETGGGLSEGIASQIAMLPAGFEQTAVLAANTGINKTYDDWGSVLRKLGGRKPVANDATPELASFGYWTDNGATYYYKTQSGADYQTTLKNVRSYFQQQGIPISYVQLDSWWYPKGSSNSWQGNGTDRGGEYMYQADSTLFPSGLGSFQQSLGIPLVTHARWIDTASPYRSMYKMSNNVSIDPAFWNSIGSYLKANGVVTYEQDWLNQNALPITTNLTDQDAFLDNMAQGMAASGINIQYCMGLPRHYMQSSKYQNVVTARVSNDRFGRNQWRAFFYTSRLAWSMGVWPWTDTFMSSEHDNLLLATMSGGIVGVGDPINGADRASIQRAIRTDGALVKPDAPILLLDRSIIAEAQGHTSPSLASTYSEHTGGRTTYVFAFADSSASVSFTPAELGYSGSVYVYDVNHASGRLLTASQANTDTVSDTAYYIVAPMGASGIAFLGEQGKLAAAGKKRITDWSDDGTLTVSVAFAAGEKSVTLAGYAASAPTATADMGAVGAVQYESAAKRFTVAVMPTGTSAIVKLHL